MSNTSPNSNKISNIKSEETYDENNNNLNEMISNLNCFQSNNTTSFKGSKPLSDRSTSGELNDYSSSSPSKSSNDYSSPQSSSSRFHQFNRNSDARHESNLISSDQHHQQLHNKRELKNDEEDTDDDNNNSNNNKNNKHVTKLFVGNLPTSTTLPELLTVFRKYGPVNEKLSVVKDQNYAFIHFYNRNDAQVALREVNDSLFKDRYIRVQFSTSQGYVNSRNKRNNNQEKHAASSSGSGASKYHSTFPHSHSTSSISNYSSLPVSSSYMNQSGMGSSSSSYFRPIVGSSIVANQPQHTRSHLGYQQFKTPPNLLIESSQLASLNSNLVNNNPYLFNIQQRELMQQWLFLKKLQQQQQQQQLQLQIQLQAQQLQQQQQLSQLKFNNNNNTTNTTNNNNQSNMFANQMSRSHTFSANTCNNLSSTNTSNNNNQLFTNMSVMQPQLMRNSQSTLFANLQSNKSSTSNTTSSSNNF